MNQTMLILSVFPLLVGTLVSGICADMYVYAQQLPSPPVAGSSSMAVQLASQYRLNRRPRCVILLTRL
jgi:hypothetical protein